MIRTIYNRLKTMASAKRLYNNLLEYHKNLTPEDIEIDRSLDDMRFLVKVNIDKIDAFGHIREGGEPHVT